MKKRTAISIIQYVAAILIAGTCDVIAKQIIKAFMSDTASSNLLPLISTVMFCINMCIYLFLLIVWMRSVQRRLLPSRERTYMIIAALCAIALMLLRSIRYRMIGELDFTSEEVLWYLYYIPRTLLPALFLMMCIRIEGKPRGRIDERLVLIPAFVIMLGILTNRLHHFAFLPVSDNPLTGNTASYTDGWLIYVYDIFAVLCVIIGLVLLTRANRRLHDIKKVLLPFFFLLIVFALIGLNTLMGYLDNASMFKSQEIISFSAVAIFESCIRNRLIPYNENYAGFFAQMRFPAMITDMSFSPGYSSAVSVRASREQLKKALDKPLYIDDDTKLSAREITAGYSFYTEDESELHRLNEKLRDANELIEGENDLIQAENELKAKQAQVDSRNLIYARIAEKMLPYHRRALCMIDEMEKDDAGFERKLAQLNLLNAYIKRGTNLLLTDERKQDISKEVLKGAFDELSLYLHYLGIQANIKVIGNVFDRTDALELFTAVYEIASRFSDETSMLQIVIDGRFLRITSDGSAVYELPDGITVEESGGLYFFGFTAEEGGAL